MNVNLMNIYNATKNDVLWCTDEYYEAFKSTIEKAIDNDFDFDQSAFTAPLPYQKVGNVAIVQFYGFTVSDCSDFAADALNLCSLVKFCAALEMAVEDDEVASVVIDFNSGGGATMYGDETCDLVKELAQVKPIYAFASGLMCSMAYAVASNCTALVGWPSALVGSIGVRTQFVTMNGTYTSDYSGSMTTAVLADRTVKTFQAGELKTVGSPVVPLTKDQEQAIVQAIQAEHKDFQNLVRSNRGDVDEADMQGQAFTVKDALEQDTNLMDGSETSLSNFVQTLLLQQTYI